jgi:hypothetical protein
MAKFSALSDTEKTEMLKHFKNLTTKGTITWEPGDSSDECSADIGDGFFVVLDSVDGDGVSPFRLRIYKSKDRGPATVEVVDISMTPGDEGGNEAINNRIIDLYTDAMRRSVRSDEDIRRVFSLLDSLERGSDEPPF